MSNFFQNTMGKYQTLKTKFWERRDHWTPSGHWSAHQTLTTLRASRTHWERHRHWAHHESCEITAVTTKIQIPFLLQMESQSPLDHFLPWYLTRKYVPPPPPHTCPGQLCSRDSHEMGGGGGFKRWWRGGGGLKKWLDRSGPFSRPVTFVGH